MRAEAAARRLAKDTGEPAPGGDGALVMMLFEAIRLSTGPEAPPAKPAKKRRARAGAAS